MKETRFKDTEIGRIPEDWEATSIEKLCTLKARIGWQGLTTGEYLLQGDYILITGTDFKDGYIDWKNCWYVSKWRYDQDSNIQIKEGDVLISKDGTIGKVAFINSTPGPGTLNSGVFVVRPKQKDIVNQGYLSWIFKSIWFKSFIDQLTAGSTINHLYQKDFVNFKLVYPNDISEQTRIASALTSIDNLISSLDKLIEKKKAIKEGTMQQLLTGKKRLKGFNEPWVMITLGEICEFRNGYTPSKRVKSFWDNGTIPWFRMEDIRDNGRILSNSIQHVTPNAIKGELFSSNSIILSTTATIGEHALLIADSLANQQFTNLKIRKSLVNRIDIMWFYWYCFIIGEWCRHNIHEGGLAAVNISDLSKLGIVIPSIEEQKKIASILSSMDNQIAFLEAKRNKYIKTKQGMMQQLLTGRIRLV